MSPYLGYTIVQEQYYLALGLLACAGITDLVSNYAMNYYYKMFLELS